MGIYDREYLRDDSNRLGWFSGTAPATRTLIAIQVIVFIVESFGDAREFLNRFAAIPDAIFGHWQVYRLLTGPFLSVPNALLPVVFGMLILYFIGRELETIYGSREFTAFYLGAAILSTLLWAIFDRYGPGTGAGVLVGSNAVIVALLVVYTLHFPMREVLLFFVLPVKMWMLLAFVLGADVWMFLSALQAGNPAVGGGGAGALVDRSITTNTVYFAHLAGAAYGWAYHALDFRWMRYVDFRRLQRPRLRLVQPEVREVVRPSVPNTPRPSSPGFVADEQFDAQLDEVLAKIASRGRESLTADERQILEEASRRARNRRSQRT